MPVVALVLFTVNPGGIPVASQTNGGVPPEAENDKEGSDPYGLPTLNRKLLGPLNEIPIPGTNVIDRVVKTNRDPASRSPTLNVGEPGPVGVPLIWPEADSVSPAGKLPLCRLQVYPVPPVAINCAL